MSENNLENLSLKELKEKAKELGISGVSTLAKAELCKVLANAVSSENSQEKPTRVKKTAKKVDVVEPQTENGEPQGDEVKAEKKSSKAKKIPAKEERSGNENVAPAEENNGETSAEETQPSEDQQGNADRKKNFGYNRNGQKKFVRNNGQNGQNNRNRKNNFAQNQNKQVNPTLVATEIDKRRASETYTPDGNFEPSAGVIDLLEAGQSEERFGVLDINPDGYGFLRAKNFEPGEKDAYVSLAQIRKFGLRRGDYVCGLAKIPTDNKPAPMLMITKVNGIRADELIQRPNFDDLVPIYPNERYKLEIKNANNDVAIRAIDLISPIGKGQRGMIVSPPKAGKTTLLKKIANSISTNYPNAKLFVLLIDERPEEVTDMQRSIKGEVVFSTFDELPEHHTKAAELLLARAKRLVELGEDVIILMDSLTRLARAYNLVVPPTGRTLSGGIDPGALHSPKRFFGSARNIENGGSLTIIATALVETNSRMDEIIFEEFKGTGNMEIHLDRKLSEKRIFPAINLNKSSTRREELLLSQSEYEAIWSMRRMLSSGDGQEATENLLNMIAKTKTNEEFVQTLKNQMAAFQKNGYTLRQFD